MWCVMVSSTRLEPQLVVRDGARPPTSSRPSDLPRERRSCERYTTTVGNYRLIDRAALGMSAVHPDPFLSAG
jgi:hypothetical protein